MRLLLALPFLALAACQAPQLDVTFTAESGTDARLCVITRGGAIDPCCTTPGKTARCKAPGVSAGTAFEVQLFRDDAPTQVWTVGSGTYEGKASSPVSFAFALTADSLAGTYTLPSGQSADAAWSVR
ncbi:MAG: hypothetical protein LCH53_09540 [Bacteroidetes bacterium]|nr:hypothetical protein [Bacteroidota bacterium]